jgi:catechol 2,3-dioxygenase-like lactoylglutathione lyase family enzyme
VHFSLVTLFVTDPKQVAGWYATNLGLTVAEESPRFVQLADRAGRPCVAFHAGEAVEHPNAVQLHFEVEDVDREYERLRSEGVSFDTPPENKPWGWRVVAARDPAGHVVELVQPVAQ